MAQLVAVTIVILTVIFCHLEAVAGDYEPVRLSEPARVELRETGGQSSVNDSSSENSIISSARSNEERNRDNGVGSTRVREPSLVREAQEPFGMQQPSHIVESHLGVTNEFWGAVITHMLVFGLPILCTATLVAIIAWFIVRRRDNKAAQLMHQRSIQPTPITPRAFSYTQSPPTPLHQPIPSDEPPRKHVVQSFQQLLSSSSQVGRSPRKVQLHKGPQGLGFNIVGGEDIGEPVYISYVMPGGAADLSGDVYKGDALLQVNNVNLRRATQGYAAQALKNANGNVILVLQHRPDDYQRFIAKMDELRNKMISQNGPLALYVRTLFDNDRSKDGALPLKPLNPSSQVGRSPRNVQLHKGSQGLGFNIVGGEDGEPVYISYVLPGGAADLSGDVYKGDVLLQVNNVNLREATHGDAAQALKNANGNVILVLQHRPDDYQRFEAKIDQLRNEMISQNGPPAPSPRRENVRQKEWDRQMSEDETQKQFQRTQMVEEQFGEAFTAIIQGYRTEEMSVKVHNVIAKQSPPMLWVSSREPLN